MDIAEKIHGDADPGRVGVQDAPRQSLTQERSINHEAELNHLMARAFSGVDVCILYLEEIVKTHAEPHVEEDLVAVLDVNLLYQHFRSVPVELLRQDLQLVLDDSEDVHDLLLCCKLELC